VARFTMLTMAIHPCTTFPPLAGTALGTSHMPVMATVVGVTSVPRPARLTAI
jgi:hypothetical protein